MHTVLKIAICDDLQTDRALLRTNISVFLDSKGIITEFDEYSCGEDLLNSDNERYHLIFIDVFMDGLNGVDTAKKMVQNNNSSKIVFCTTSPDFAVDSYEVYAFNYLLKPVSRERLNTVLERFVSTFNMVQSIEVNVGRNTEKIAVTDIIWVESARKKCVFHTRHGEIEVIAKFSDIFDSLAEYDFIKPIRYAIVSLKEISNIRNDITLSNGEVISVSRDMRDLVKKTFADYNWRVMLQRSGERL